MATKPTTIKERYNKTQILDAIAAGTALSRKQVTAAMATLHAMGMLVVNRGFDPAMN